MQQRKQVQAHLSSLELFDNAMAVCRAQIQELHVQPNNIERSLLTSQEDNKIEKDLSLYLLKRVRKKVSVPVFRIASNDAGYEDKNNTNIHISSNKHEQNDGGVSTLQQQLSTHERNKPCNPSTTLEQQSIPQSHKTQLSPPPEQSLEDSCMIFSENMIHKRMAESIALGCEGSSDNNSSTSQISKAKHPHKSSQKHKQNSSQQAIQYQFATLKDKHISEENLRLLNQVSKITSNNNSLQVTPQQSHPSSSNPSSNPPSSPAHEQSTQPKFVYPKITVASPENQLSKMKLQNQEHKAASRNSSTSVADPSPPLIPSLSTRLSSQSETYLRVYSQISSPQQASPPNASLPSSYLHDNQYQQIPYASTNIKNINGTVQYPQYPHYSPSFLPNSPLNSFFTNTNPLNYPCQSFNNNANLYSSLKAQTSQQSLIQQSQQYSSVLAAGCHPILEKLSTQGKNEQHDHIFTTNSQKSHANITSSGYNAGSSSGLSRGSILGGNTNNNNTTSILNNNNNNLDDFQYQQQSSSRNSIRKSKEHPEKDCNNEEIILPSNERRISSQFKSAFSVGDEEELAEKQKEILKEKSLKYLNQDFFLAKRTQSMELQDDLFHPHKSVNSNPSESGEATLVFESLKSQKCFASILQQGQSNNSNNPATKIDELFPRPSSSKANISDISQTCTSVDLNE